MDDRKKNEIINILELDEEEQLVFFATFDVKKALQIYDKIKDKTSIKKAINIISNLLNDKKIEITSELIEGLLMDDELREYVLNNDSNNNLFKKLSESLTSEEDIDDISEFDVNAEKEVEESNKDKTLKDFPIYDEEEEKEVFQKYDYLKMKLELYIYTRAYHHDPIFEKFIDYINNLQIEKKDGSKIKAMTKDNFIVRTIGELYRNTDIEEIVNVKKDKNVYDLVEELREIRDDISYHNMRLVTSIARKYSNRGLPVDDLVQEGSIGLDKAINKYEVSRGNKFSTFAVHWIRQAVTRALADEGSTIRIPSHLRDKLYKINVVERMIRKEEQIDNPTIDDIYRKCQELGYSYTYDMISEYKKIEKNSNPVSSDQYVGEDEDTALIDFLSNNNVESPVDYAERNERKEKIEKALSEIYLGRIQSKNERLGVIILFKKIIFYTKDNEKIEIILTEKEFDYFSNKDLTPEEKRDHFKETLDRYKLDPNLLSSRVNVFDLEMTSGQREALVYRFRRDLLDEEADDFMKKRNYNCALFDIREIKKELTLETTGKLFGVTRERIRQIETRVERKIDAELGYKVHKSCKTLELYIGDRANVYNALHISPSNTEYFTIVKPNTVIRVNENGDIITTGETGTAQIILRNARNSMVKELIVYVHPPLKDLLNDASIKKVKILKNNEKDNQN